MVVHSSLTFIALVAVAALICGLVMARLKQPAIVGYILAGVLLGPSGLALVEDRAQINELAELGVLMLVFLIGMELSLRAFITVLRVALLGTLLQVAISLAVTLALSQLLGWPIGLAVLLGFVVALSSTAVAIKMLEDIDELRSDIGRRTVGILIAQDLAVVPMMLTLNGMASEGGFDVVAVVVIALATGFLALFVWYLSRRQRIRLPMSRWVVGDHDLTPLAALAYCFAAAAISGLLGLSAAYGAFLAGLLVGASTDRAAMIRATHPIQAVLLMIFFLSIGLLIDLRYIWENLASVLVLLLIVTIGKTAMNIGILRLLGEPWPRAFLSGVILGQIGEFSFVIAALGLSNGLISIADHRLVISVIALSLMISPLWLSVARRLDEFATAGIPTLKELLGKLYPRETAAVRQSTDVAVRRTQEMVVSIERRSRGRLPGWLARLMRRFSGRPADDPDAAFEDDADGEESADKTPRTIAPPDDDETTKASGDAA